MEILNVNNNKNNKNMALDDIFKINLPYGMMKNQDGKWAVFNRGYHPLSNITSDPNDNLHEFVYIKYNGLTENLLLEIADKFERGSDEKINKIWFYKSGNNPSLTNKKEDWENYFSKLKKIGRLKIKP